MRHVSQCTNFQLSALCKKVMRYEKLDELILPHLPKHLQTHCCVESFEKGTLNILVSDSVWAYELRYLLPELRDKLRNVGLYQLGSIKLKISNTTLQPATKKQNQAANPLSEQARQTIMQASEQCQYQPLQDVLKRLAKMNKD